MLVSNAFAQPVEYKIDKSHSNIGFVVKHLVITKVRGDFQKYDAQLFYDEKDITKSSVDVTIDVASIDTENERRDNHLRSGDFFDAENNPQITFKSTSFGKDGDQLYAMGNLTIRGVTKEVKLPFEMTEKIVDPWGNTRFGVEASLEINRFDYGVKWDKKMDTGGLVVSEEVKIEIQLEAVEKK
ncbi:MAG: polyisoprenoid-binding protein [Deferribacteres bacterium]|nr:polyisoprenoid-binding protein [candidate division KSB1 bacterium]MCB9501273.1 polyisoprenoid-binding protein [Deferribacteres bacterium]